MPNQPTPWTGPAHLSGQAPVSPLRQIWLRLLLRQAFKNMNKQPMTQVQPPPAFKSNIA